MALLDTISAAIGEALSRGASLLERDAPPIEGSSMYHYGKTGMPAHPKAGEGLKQYQQNPWAYAGTNAVVDAFATTELFIRKRIVNSDGSFDYEIRRDHQALELMENHLPDTPSFRGKRYLTKTTLKQLVGLHLMGAGEAFWAIGGNVDSFAGFRGVPTELHPLVPELVNVKFDENTNLIKAYGYRVAGKEYLLSPESVVHFKRIDPRNPHRGQSAYLSSGTALDTDRESDLYSHAWFKNRATPDTVVFSEKAPSKEEQTRLREAWDSRFGGSSNAGKVSFLWGGKDIKDISRSQRDMQFKELKEFNRDVIMANLRTGKGIIGMMEDQSRANAETQDYVFGKRVLYPMLVTFCEQLSQDFLPYFGGEAGEHFWFDEEAVLPDDKFITSQVCEKLWNIGAISANEVRSKFSLDARDEPEADTLWYPIAKNGAGMEEPESPVGFGEEDENEDDEGEEDDGERDLFRGIKPRVLRSSDPIKIKRAGDLFDEQKEIEIFRKNAEGYMDEGMRAGIELGSEQVGETAFSIDDMFDFPAARQAVKTISFEHAVNTLGGTKTILQKILDKGLQEGRSNQEVAAAIAKVYGKQFKGYRARRIARTEVTAAVNAGTGIVYQAEGIENKVWVVTQDGRQRATHQDAHDLSHRSPVKIDNFFDVGGYKAAYPGDPSLPPGERVNCRCTTVSADFLHVMQDRSYIDLFLRQHGSLEKQFARSLAVQFEAQKKRVLERIS